MNSATFLNLWLCLSLGTLSALVRSESSLKGVSTQKRQNGGYDPYHNDCLVNGYRYQHGQIFSIPGYSHCIRYRCNRGGWDIYRGACQVDGQCHRVGSYFEKHCRTYRCVKEDRKDHVIYRPSLLRTRCEDAKNRCRSPGEIFTKVLKGKT
ncbi:hypothetical protein RRG08_015848 [Elysia crispata]|uniref:Uncharacterized protein n=1 Tax=Elysia crispata TaxID=231223 RepID=A0AAE0ZGC9_9GAST|nr:hypothetical protein RRG08_015848 [Elysia crispata]